MFSPAALLPALSLVKYPLAVTGAVVVFGVSSHGALSLIAANADKFTQPVTLSGDFNLPPVKQLADLTPVAVEPTKPINDGGSSIVTLPRPDQTTQVALAPNDAGSFTGTSLPLPSGDMRPGRVGPDAVNVRAGASKNSPKIGTLQAGAPVMMGANNSGWVAVQFEGGAGWVYQSYLTSGGGETEVTVDYGSTASITVRGGKDGTPSGKGRLVEAGSSMVARSEPSSGSERMFRIQPGERLRIIDRDGDWARVTTATGESGWVRLG